MIFLRNNKFYYPLRSQKVLIGYNRIQFKVLPSCFAKSSDCGSALLKNDVNVLLFNV